MLLLVCKYSFFLFVVFVFFVPIHLYTHTNTMPYTLRKLRNQLFYKVYNPITKRVYAKRTTLAKAKRQLGLLRAYGK